MGNKYYLGLLLSFAGASVACNPAKFIPGSGEKKTDNGGPATDDVAENSDPQDDDASPAPQPTLHPFFTGAFKLNAGGVALSDAAPIIVGRRSSAWEPIPDADHLLPLSVITDSKMNVAALGNINWNGCVSGEHFFNYYLKMRISRDSGANFSEQIFGPFAIANSGRSIRAEAAVDVKTGDVIVVKQEVKIEESTLGTVQNNGCISDYVVKGVLDISFDAPSNEPPVKIPANFSVDTDKPFDFFRTAVAAEIINPKPSAANRYEEPKNATTLFDITPQQALPAFELKAKSLLRATMTGNISWKGSCAHGVDFQPVLAVSQNDGVTFNLVTYPGEMFYANSGDFAIPLLMTAEPGQKFKFLLQIRFQDELPLTIGDCVAKLNVDGQFNIAIYPFIQ